MSRSVHSGSLEEEEELAASSEREWKEGGEGNADVAATCHEQRAAASRSSSQRPAPHISAT